MEELLLTDDEVVAIAGDRDGRWPLPLPTVDIAREKPWREAAWRGRRSLAVRRLVGVGATDDAVLDRVRRDVVDARSALTLRLGAAGASAFEVNAFAGTADADDLVVETVSDQGVHGFACLPYDALVERLTGLAEQAHARGVAGRTGTATLRIGVVGDGRRPSLRVGAGRAEVVEVEDDRVVGGPPRPVPDLAAEVARLAEGIRRSPGLVTVAGRS